MRMRSAAIFLAPIVFCAQAAMAELNVAPRDLDCEAVIGSDMGFGREAQVEQWFQDLAYCHDTIVEVAEYLSNRGFSAYSRTAPEGHFMFGKISLDVFWSRQRHGTRNPFDFPFYEKLVGRGLSIGATFNNETKDVESFTFLQTIK